MSPLELGDWFRGTAFSGSMFLAIPVAVIAGLVSFFSPCVVPLLPGYLSYATGLSGADIVEGDQAPKSRMLAGSVLFVLGFSLVFVSFGALFGQLGSVLLQHQRVISIVMGAVVIVLGLAFMDLIPGLNRDIRIHKVPAVGVAAAPLLGALFGLGWTPCIGPTLGAINTLAMQEGSAWRGAILSLCYCLGLGLPFVVAALAYRRMLRAITFVRRHQAWVMRIGGGMLIVVGVLLVTGWWDVIVNQLRGSITGFATGI